MLGYYRKRGNIERLFHPRIELLQRASTIPDAEIEHEIFDLRFIQPLRITGATNKNYGPETDTRTHTLLLTYIT